MLEKTSTKFMEFFLVEFSKEMIRSTNTYRRVFIKKEVEKKIEEEKTWFPGLNKRRTEEDKEKIKIFVKEKIKKDSQRIDGLKKTDSLNEFNLLKTRSNKPEKKNPMTRLEIREPLLPETVRNLMPIPRQEEISLDKINVLIKDSLVKTIECNGPDEKIVVTGAMGRKSTGITLNKDDIDFIIQRFSEATRIPIHEGIFRVVFGRLSLLAVISEIVGSKFIIRKMSLPPIQIPFRR